MSTTDRDPTTIRLLTHLHRGGAYAYWWTLRGTQKTSIWWHAGRPTPLPPGQHQLYFGVHPCAAIPPTNREGTRVPPAAVRAQLPYIAAINCLFAEFDAKDFTGGKVAARAHIEGLDPVPSVIVDSGGGYHCYWLLLEPFILATDAARARADRVQKGWVQRVGSDEGAKDLARVLRVPGTRNYKPEYGPDYPTVRVVRADFDRLYSFDELESLFLADAPAPLVRTNSTGQALRSRLDEVDWAAQNLARLAAWRCDAYASWVEVGMALAELGSTGLSLWDAWSRGSDKYTPGECERKWTTFTPGSGITLGSLAYWADQDDPRQPHNFQGPGNHVETGTDDDIESLDAEELRRRLRAVIAERDRYKAERDELKLQVSWEQQIAACPSLKPTEKGVLLGMYPIITANRHLGGNDDRVPINYDHVAQVLKTSKSTVGRAVETAEKIGLWRRDPEMTENAAGYAIPHMHLELQPAFDDPTQAITIERTKQGGARPGAGRKPTCVACPPGTHVRKITERKASYYCLGCGERIAEEQLPDLIETYNPNEFQDETEDQPVDHSVANLPLDLAEDTAGAEDDIHVETEYEATVAATPAPRPADRQPPTQYIPPPLVIDDPLALPGVRAGALRPDDPWLTYVRQMSSKGTAPPSAEAHEHLSG